MGSSSSNISCRDSVFCLQLVQPAVAYVTAAAVCMSKQSRANVSNTTAAAGVIFLITDLPHFLQGNSPS